MKTYMNDRRAILLMAVVALAGVGCEAPRSGPTPIPITTEALWRAPPSAALPPWDERNDLRLLYVQLKLRENTIREDVEIGNALRYAKGIVTHVILVVPSWQERPNAANNPIVRRAMATCRAMHLGVFWGRWLWVGWPSHEFEELLPGPASHFDATYYAAAISTLRAEARLLGAVGTFLDAEPYGDSAQKPTLKFKHLTAEDRQAISAAVRDAVQYAGPVDLIYPASSNLSTHYSWPLEGLARFRCDAKPFYQRKSSGQIVARPPTGYEHKLHFWGSFVTTPASRQIGGATSTSWTLTIDEAKALDLDIIRERFSECRGLWVYSDQLVAVLREWGG